MRLAIVLLLLLAPSRADVPEPAEATVPAVRLGVISDEYANLDACAEMHAYRVAVGLPARFDAIGYRESRCTNTPISRTGCCVGYLQLHKMIWNDHRMKARLAACGATWLNVRGDSFGAKWRQMCAAKALYDVAGYGPWAT